MPIAVRTVGAGVIAALLVCAPAVAGPIAEGSDVVLDDPRGCVDAHLLYVELEDVLQKYPAQVEARVFPAAALDRATWQVAQAYDVEISVVHHGRTTPVAPVQLTPGECPEASAMIAVKVAEVLQPRARNGWPPVIPDRVGDAAGWIVAGPELGIGAPLTLAGGVVYGRVFDTQPSERLAWTGGLSASFAAPSAVTPTRSTAHVHSATMIGGLAALVGDGRAWWLAGAELAAGLAVQCEGEVVRSGCAPIPRALPRIALRRVSERSAIVVGAWVGVPLPRLSLEPAHPGMPERPGPTWEPPARIAVEIGFNPRASTHRKTAQGAT